MKVVASPYRSQGRLITRAVHRETPGVSGHLEIGEAKDHRLGRVQRTARLLSNHNGTEPDVLPALRDVQLLYLKDGEFTLAGYETLEGVDYQQTWLVRLD